MQKIGSFKKKVADLETLGSLYIVSVKIGVGDFFFGFAPSRVRRWGT